MANAGDDTAGDSDHRTEPAGSDWLSTIADFDWLRIPGAVRAIARVVTGSADAANAWIDVVGAKGEQRSAAIRDVTAARRMTTHALAVEVAKSVTADHPTLQRAMQHLVSDELRKQANREEVAADAAALLQDLPPEQNTPGPNEDWLNIFASHAEKASSERLRKHWASVLAGEIRRPGTFSLTALHLLSVLDQELATVIARIACNVISRDFIPLLGKFERGESYLDLMKLSSIGFILLGSSKYFPLAAGTRYFFTNFDKVAVVVGGTGEVRLQAAILTPAGGQILSLLDDVHASEDGLNLFAELFRSHGATVVVDDLVSSLQKTS